MGTKATHNLRGQQLHPVFNPIAPIVGAAKAAAHVAVKVAHVLDQASGVEPVRPELLTPQPTAKKKRR